MSRSMLTSKGQTTIPKDVRKPFTLPLENPLEYVIDEEWSSAGAAGDDRSRHRASRDHHDRDERTQWYRSEQAAAGPGTIDGGAVE